MHIFSVSSVSIVWMICVVLIQYMAPANAKPPKPSADTRPGRCPHPQYAFSSLPCSEEGNDTVCPSNYKCCPLTQGLQCFAPCPEWSKPCNRKCKFGLQVTLSPCTTCKCAKNPCLDRNCPRGTSCKVKKYEPCVYKGRCGYTTECVNKRWNVTEPITKPKRCPDYWPQILYNVESLVKCSSSDAQCPGNQKCCEGPSVTDGDYPSNDLFSYEPGNYCADPCESLDTCTLNCPHGFEVQGGCQICECIKDGCLTTTCPPGQTCYFVPAPCAHYPGMPPCQKLPICW